MIDIVFKDGDPANGQAILFVEVENEKGQSIRVGEWVDREDGFRVLRFHQGAEALMQEICDWQLATFGAVQPLQGMVNHLVREALELQAEPSNGEEMADVFILLVGLAERAGVDLVLEARRKMEVNKGRTWKDVDHDGVIEHEKEEPTV